MIYDILNSLKFEEIVNFLHLHNRNLKISDIYGVDDNGYKYSSYLRIENSKYEHMGFVLCDEYFKFFTDSNKAFNYTMKKFKYSYTKSEYSIEYSDFVKFLRKYKIDKIMKL